MFGAWDNRRVIHTNDDEHTRPEPVIDPALTEISQKDSPSPPPEDHHHHQSPSMPHRVEPYPMSSHRRYDVHGHTRASPPPPIATLPSTHSPSPSVVSLDRSSVSTPPIRRASSPSAPNSIYTSSASASAPGTPGTPYMYPSSRYGDSETAGSTGGSPYGMPAPLPPSYSNGNGYREYSSGHGHSYAHSGHGHGHSAYAAPPPVTHHPSHLAMHPPHPSQMAHHHIPPSHLPPHHSMHPGIHPLHHSGMPGHPGHGIPGPVSSFPISYTEDAATKLSDRVRRRCFNCCTTDTSTWRRSNLNPGKVLCNKCGLFERTHSRPRPEQFPHKRGPLSGTALVGVPPPPPGVGPGMPQKVPGGMVPPHSQVEMQTQVQTSPSLSHHGSPHTKTSPQLPPMGMLPPPPPSSSSHTHSPPHHYSHHKPSRPSPLSTPQHSTSSLALSVDGDRTRSSRSPPSIMDSNKLPGIGSWAGEKREVSSPPPMLPPINAKEEL